MNIQTPLAGRGNAEPLRLIITSPSEFCWPVRIRAAMDALRDCLPWGLIVVDQNARVVHATPYAQTLLNSACGIRMMSETLYVDRAGLNRQLAEQIRATASGQKPASTAQSIIGVPNREGRTRFALRLFQFDAAAGLVLVAIIDLMNGIQVRRSMVAAIFGLSDREAEFAEFFSEGLRVQQIAERMGVTVNTARVHLRNVFTKTGASSQIQLARIFTMLPYLVGLIDSAPWIP